MDNGTTNFYVNGFASMPMFVHSFADTHTYKRTHTPFADINMVILQQIPQIHAYVTFSKGNIDHFRISFSFNSGGQHFYITANYLLNFCWYLMRSKLNRFNIFTQCMIQQQIKRALNIFQFDPKHKYHAKYSCWTCTETLMHDRLWNSCMHVYLFENLWIALTIQNVSA